MLANKMSTAVVSFNIRVFFKLRKAKKRIFSIKTGRRSLFFLHANSINLIGPEALFGRDELVDGVFNP